MINAAVNFLQSHRTTFGVFDVKSSGLGHTVINGNLRERVAAWCVVEDCDYRNNSVRTRNLLSAGSLTRLCVCVRAQWAFTCYLVYNNRNRLISVSESGAQAVVILQSKDIAEAATAMIL